MPNFCSAGMFSLLTIGASSRSAASLTCSMLRFPSMKGVFGSGSSSCTIGVGLMSSIGAETGSAGATSSGTGIGSGSGAGIGSGFGIGAGAFGGIGGRGATGGIGRGGIAGVALAALKGPTGAGAATGSEKSGSPLVDLVISSIAFCRSLSTVVFWFICPPLIKLLMFIIAHFFLNAQEIY